MHRMWPSYAHVRRWHFYAGLFCVPFVLWLALTGSVYLFKPQIEALLDRPYAHVASEGVRAPTKAQARAAMDAVPGSALRHYELPRTTRQAVQIVVRAEERDWRVYVHPQTLDILKVVDEERRPMRIVFRLHGELLAGDRGSYLVELAASWAIVMILSGLFLWWPRGMKAKLAGVVYPRVRAGRRRFWRDLHGVVGFWVSFFALFLLVSGLPWSTAWGGYLKMVRTAMEGGPVEQDWSTGRADEHGGHGGRALGRAPVDLAPLDQLVTTIEPLNLAAPVVVAPPATPEAPWTVRSDAANRPLRTTLSLDGETGAILHRQDFSQRPMVDRVVGYGIAIHEGQLFGLPNQLLNLLTAVGLMLLSISSIILWLGRKPDSALGAPPAPSGRPAATGFVLLLLFLGVLLPLFGTSLLLLMLVERLVLRHLPRVRQWLDLA